MTGEKRTCVPYYLCNMAMDIAQVHVDDVAEMLSQGLMMALCATPPRLYPRSRWAEAEEAVEYIALLEACHGLLTPSFDMYVVRQGGKLRRGSVDGSEDTIMAFMMDAPPPVAEAAIANRDEHTGPENTCENGTTPACEAEDNARYRRQSLAFLDTAPLSRILFLRMVMALFLLR